jgi:HlyD family secretion protein
MVEFFKRWRWALLIAALLLAWLIFAFWPQATKVDTAKIDRGPMTVGITDDGVTRAREYYVLSAPVTGFASRIELEVGDPVVRGQLVTTMSGRPSTPLDPRTRAELQAALAAARASANGAEATLTQGRRDLERAEELARRGFLPRSQLEAARTKVQSGNAATAQARAEIARLQAMLFESNGSVSGKPVAVRAPITGSVLAVINESEGVIAEGTPLLTIGDAGDVEAVVDLLSREAIKVKPGDKVEIKQWGGDEPLIGRVARVEPSGQLKVSALGIEEQRVNVIIDIDFASAPGANRLGHGYQVDATIQLWNRPDALRVPIGALFRGADGGWRVFTLEEGRARERSLKIGHINEEYGEVLGGLNVGQIVVLNPGASLKSNARIEAR